MISRTKKVSAARMVEVVVGCKWSLAVLGREKFAVLMDGVERLQRELEP